MKNNLSFQIHNILSQNIEGIIFDILLPKSKPITIGIFYRPPNQNDFLETLTNDLDKLDHMNKELYLLGDFNINLLKNGKYIFENKNCVIDSVESTLLKKYKEFSTNFSLKQLIHKATRVTGNSPDSLLDHVLTNAIQNVSQSDIIDLALSDHQLIYLTRKINHKLYSGHNEVKFKSLKNYSAEKFKQLLAAATFPDYEKFKNVDEAYCNFHEKLMDVINKIAPSKVSRIKNKTPDWFDLEISEKIKVKRKIFRKFKKSKLHSDKELYLTARNDVNRTIKRKKEAFVKEKLEQNINEPKALWKTLKSLGLPSKRSSMAKICLKDKDKLIFDSKGIAEIFKDYFSSLAENLVSKLPPALKIYDTISTKSYYSKLNASTNSFKFNECNKDIIEKILLNFNVSKAAGIDDLNSRFLKDGAEILSTPLMQICNLSLKLSTFPTECKVAKLKPLFKKGSLTEPKNYRPISLLPLLSKVLEKVVLDQTQNYLKENDLIYELQSGFRNNHSTNFCLSFLSDKILSGFDSGLLTGMILIDLQKAFDTINHVILLQKMEIMGFSKKSIDWFESYLGNRTFLVSIEKSFSSSGNLKCGVPQGSILGP
mgnify:FL=1